MNTFILVLRNLVSTDNLEAALSVIKSFIEQRNATDFDTCTLLEGRLSSLARQLAQGTITEVDARHEKAQISVGIMEMIDKISKLPDEDADAIRYFDMLDPNPMMDKTLNPNYVKEESNEQVKGFWPGVKKFWSSLSNAIIGGIAVVLFITIFALVFFAQQCGGCKVSTPETPPIVEAPIQTAPRTETTSASPAPVKINLPKPPATIGVKQSAYEVAKYNQYHDELKKNGVAKEQLKYLDSLFDKAHKPFDSIKVIQNSFSRNTGKLK